MEVLYHIRPYVQNICPYIGLTYGRYLQFRFLKWPLNIHAAITMRFAASRGKPAPIYARGNIRWRQSCSHSNAIFNQRFKNRIKLRTQTQPLVAEHRAKTDRVRNDPKRNRRTDEVPFIAGCSHFTRKNIRFRIPASSPKHSPCNIHAAITMRFCSIPWQTCTYLRTWQHQMTTINAAISNAICNQRFKNRIETTHTDTTTRCRTQRRNRSRPERPQPQPPLSSPAAATLHGKTQGFVLQLSSPKQSPCIIHASSPLPFVITSLKSPLPFITTSLRHHFPSSPLPFVTTSHRHHFPSSPLPFVTTLCHSHHLPRPHLPSLPLPFITTSLCHHFPSSPLPIVPTSLPSSPLPFLTTFPSSPPPIVPTSLPHHFPFITTSLRHHFPFITTSHRHHFPWSPPPIVPTSLAHHFPSSPLPSVSTSRHHHFPSSPLPIVTTSLQFPSSPLPFNTTSFPHHPVS